MPEPKKWSLDTPIYNVLKIIAPKVCPTIISPTHITIVNMVLSGFILYSVAGFGGNENIILPLFYFKGCFGYVGWNSSKNVQQKNRFWCMA